MDLPRNADYVWVARSASACGIVTSTERTLSVGNGLVFTERAYGFTVDRDYNQLRSIGVQNQDVAPHTLLLTIESPTPGLPPAGGDGRGGLIVGFVGSGSVDEVVTLAPGERIQEFFEGI